MSEERRPGSWNSRLARPARRPCWRSRRVVFENSLVLVMGALWLGSWFAQSVTGVTEYNAERLDHREDAVSWADYLSRPDFWEKTLQNWQSEFLAAGIAASSASASASWSACGRVEAATPGRRPA